MRRGLLVGTVCLVAGFAGLFIWHGPFHAGPSLADAQSAPPAIPVTTVTATPRDVPVYLRGIGAVQAFKTVEIRAQVSGTLVAVPVKEGQEVHKGDVVAEIDPRPFKAALDQATAQRAEDAAQLFSARLDLQRFQDLAKRNFAPVQQVDDQLATVNKLAAAVQADDAAVETAQINLGFATIRSPIDGRVSLYQTDEGNLILAASQTNIISITQDKPIEVVFTLPEEEFPRVQSAMTKGALSVHVFSGDGKTLLSEGSLLAPNNSIDSTTGTISLKANFPNEDDKLWPGEFVDAAVLVDTLHNAVSVPATAVVHGPNGLYAFVVNPNNTVRQQTVTVSYRDGGTVVIGSGIKPNEQVVTAGQSRLTPGARIAINSSANNTASAPKLQQQADAAP
jgi:membrane fusion protein, multidrug efflux system